MTNNSILSVLIYIAFSSKIEKNRYLDKRGMVSKCTGQMQPLSWDGDGGFDKITGAASGCNHNLEFKMSLTLGLTKSLVHHQLK